jgi:hypothetical protein
MLKAYFELAALVKDWVVTASEADAKLREALKQEFKRLD